jgi:hypothetical protein
MAEKLKPYGFIRIHRSVVVNISAVEEIQPLPTGEYRLRVKGGKEYLVTRTYKDDLSDLAQPWVGCAFPANRQPWYYLDIENSKSPSQLTYQRDACCKDAAVLPRKTLTEAGGSV